MRAVGKSSVQQIWPAGTQGVPTSESPSIVMPALLPAVPNPSNRPGRTHRLGSCILPLKPTYPESRGLVGRSHHRRVGTGINKCKEKESSSEGLATPMCFPWGEMGLAPSPGELLLVCFWLESGVESGVVGQLWEGGGSGGLHTPFSFLFFFF